VDNHTIKNPHTALGYMGICVGEIEEEKEEHFLS